MALIKVLDLSEKDFAMYRDRVYASPKDQPTGKLGRLLDIIHDDSHSRSQLLSWMEPHAIRQLMNKVHNGMDSIKESLRLKILPLHLNSLQPGISPQSSAKRSVSMRPSLMKSFTVLHRPRGQLERIL